MRRKEESKAKKWLEKKGIHPSEPIYWDLVHKQIYLHELMDEYATEVLREELDGILKFYAEKFEMTFTNTFRESLVDEYLKEKEIKSQITE